MRLRRGGAWLGDDAAASREIPTTMHCGPVRAQMGCGAGSGGRQARGGTGWCLLLGIVAVPAAGEAAAGSIAEVELKFRYGRINRYYTK